MLSQTLGTIVTPVLCVRDAQLPWGELMAEGIPTLAGDRVVTTLRALLPLLDEIQVTLLTGQVRRQFHPAA